MAHIQRKTVFTLIVTLLALLWPTAMAFAQSGVWTVISSPNHGGTTNNHLFGVAPVSASDIWAVGEYNVAAHPNNLRTLAEHWNGNSWSIISTPNQVTGLGDYNSLPAVAAVSTGNVWAVGYSGNASVGADKTLIEQWNGTAWSIVPGSNPDTSQDLHGVVAISASDIWAVGGYSNFNPNFSSGALIEQWNGTVWSAVSDPAFKNVGSLYGVTAIASNNVWAVGDSNTVGGAQILHWNGTTWGIVSSPHPPNGNIYQLLSVAAVSASNIWAVGFVDVHSGDGYIYDTLIEHWDGSSWKLVSGVEPNAGYDSLSGVTVLSATKVWAVGDTLGQSFVEQWNGTRWTRISSPNVGTSNNTFQAVAAIQTTGDVWAVGEYYKATPPYQAQTLVERCMAC